MCLPACVPACVCARMRRFAQVWDGSLLISHHLLSLQWRPKASSEAAHGVSLVFYTGATFHVKGKEGPMQGLTPLAQPWSSLKCQQRRKHSFPRWHREPRRCSTNSFWKPLGPSQLHGLCHLKCLFYFVLFCFIFNYPLPHTEKLLLLWGNWM